jgi:hypothetical protein
MASPNKIYVSVKGAWYTTSGRIEKHYLDEKGKLVREYVASTKTKDLAEEIVNALNRACENTIGG